MLVVVDHWLCFECSAALLLCLLFVWLTEMEVECVALTGQHEVARLFDGRELEAVERAQVGTRIGRCDQREACGIQHYPGGQQMATHDEDDK